MSDEKKLSGGSVRRQWTTEENQRLIDLWHSTGSIALISLLMDRNAASIQTQASRINLPQRNEDGMNHRRRWSTDDEVRLFEIIDSLERIDIKAVARQFDRSTDAIVSKIVDRYGKNSPILSRIDTNVTVSSRNLVSGPGPGTRLCLSCRKPFHSSGKKHRICPTCTTNNKEKLDDYGYF